MAAELEQQKGKTKATDFSEFAGMWQDYDVSQQSIRSKTWK